jgi:predicted Ser/Thr protein kinase
MRFVTRNITGFIEAPEIYLFGESVLTMRFIMRNKLKTPERRAPKAKSLQPV